MTGWRPGTTRAGAAVSTKVHRPRQGRFGFGDGRRMISATGRISLIAPAVCPADHYCPLRRAKAEATVERASASPVRDWCRGPRHVGDRGTPLSSGQSNSRWSRQMAGSTLSPVDQAPLAERKLTVYRWVTS
jgi:hypothetical protein